MSTVDPPTTQPTSMSRADSEDLVKSRRRVIDHGEVFTPSWMVEEMLDLVKDETERIDSRFLESACGSGNFLRPVLAKKLALVEARYGKSQFERKHFALFSLMCIYGIELLGDNVIECRSRLLEIYANYLALETTDPVYKAAEAVLNVNILQGDALTLTATDGSHIVFPEWGYLGNGKYQRRDFRYDDLTQRAAIKGTLFEASEEHQLFIPIKTYPQMHLEEIAK